jgi:hypothetical protein
LGWFILFYLEFVMSKQTAVEWFMDILLDIEEISLSQLKEIERAYLQARQMEKEQMYEFWKNGIKCESGEGPSFDKYMEIKYEGKI